MGLFGIGSPPPAALDYRLRRLERKLDLILTHLGIAIEKPDELEPIREILLRAPWPGSAKIPAIKAYREMTGVDLAEAKRVIDQLAAEIEPGHPAGKPR